MYSQTAFQTRGLWPSAAPHFQSHKALAFEPPVAPTLSPLARFTNQVKRPLTPPEDMSSIAYNYRPMGKYQEHGLHNADMRYPYASSHDSVTDTVPEQRNMSHYSRAHISRQSSPTHSHHSFASNSSHHQRQASQASLIAPSLQIPKTINNSQGSLSELAAQVTCLFWFESSSVLDFAEDPSSAVLPLPSLKKETSPSSGFRKWVTTIISTTQVAQNVILLALLFIYRLKRQNPSVQGKEGSEYRLLTVALMLGNKFLDDNTYTNKTWADVSGISVAEVHIMEVEFLSNMKYNLFTSAEQWTKWQTQLGRFARFLERASQPQTLPMPQNLPLSQASYGQISLPSPPTSFQASPPRTHTPAASTNYLPPLQQPAQFSATNPSPLAPITSNRSRKRSLEEDEVPQAAKRVMYSNPYQSQQYSQQPSSVTGRGYEAQGHPQQYPSALSFTPVESLSRPSSQAPPRDQAMLNRLPPLTQHLKTPASTQASAWQQPPTSMAHMPNAMAAALQSARSSRNHSPYLSSTNVSPTNTSLMPVTHQSPSFFLSQRDSPYKPVRGVHTLLVPPPSRAMHQPEHVGNNQMHYQPLGRPQERQQGRLPYVSQDQWFDNSQRVTTTGEQWPSFMAHDQMQAYQRSQPQQLL
ncbi:Cyclin-like protein 5 [Elsinoe fawcettii]|nr:Cyclin-like protein 5 [Elsinoe fawcettii]